MSIKGPGNTFDLNPKWLRNLPSLIYCSWDIHRDPLHKQKIKYQSWYLTPCCGLEVQKPTQALKAVKGPANTFDWNTKWARTLPSFDICSWVIYRDPPNQNIKVVFRDSLRHISGGSEGEQAITHGLLEVTSPEAALTGNDVTRSHVTGSYVITGSMFCVFPRFFSYYSSSTKCTIAYDRK
jgi:hypothetical protein